MSIISLIRPDKSVIICDDDFRDMISPRTEAIVGIAHYIANHPIADSVFTRPLLARLLSESSQLVELLDAYGADNNSRWSTLRAVIHAIKCFTDVSYELRHLRHVLPSYMLLKIEHDFENDTENAWLLTVEALRRCCKLLLVQVDELDLTLPNYDPDDNRFVENLPPGRLPCDCESRKSECATATITQLVTEFLNLAARSDLVKQASKAKPEEYASLIPGTMSEEQLRQLRDQFRNMQTLYDTFVSQTQMEELDPDLPVLRGHISVVYHLLHVATSFVHLYERYEFIGSQRHHNAPVDPQRLLKVLMEYSMAYANRYLDCVQFLCQQMLKCYAEVGHIQVSVPRYRGFHVRPSTLVAKIVLHYGSTVWMEMDGDSYDASSPMEIFRANEKINARKRKWLAEQIAELPETMDYDEDGDVQQYAMHIITKLAEAGKVVIYARPLTMSDEPVSRRGTLLEWIVAEVARLMATGKIDIDAEISLGFNGDKRVLADLQVLAENGYGEDNFGNNITLPKELIYLRR